jgi:3-phenylpropionate/trans-cinnamate dioxygenase ferredoxin reductase subunit
VERVVVVGAGLAGLRVVERLHELGAGFEVVLVGAEQHRPYDRPPLSKEVLRGERATPYLVDDLAALGVHARLGRRAVALHPDQRTVLLDDGTSLPYDAVVVATGASPRRLPGLHGDGVHVLRTVEDAEALRADVQRSRRVVVVGGGFIGCEVASSARALGAEVTLVELLPAPLARVLGPAVAAEVAALHRDSGVQLRCGVGVVEARGEGADRELVLSDGSAVRAGVVVVGLGVLPEVGWLEGSGLAVDDGVLCDEHGRTSAAGVWAAGDVARWYHPLLGDAVRLEHWTTAGDHGRAVAADIAGHPEPLGDVPYFWSDQHGVKLQVLGVPHADDDVTLLRVGPEPGRLLAVYGRDGRFTAVLGLSAARFVMRMRPLLADGADLQQALAAARS